MKRFTLPSLAWIAILPWLVAPATACSEHAVAAAPPQVVVGLGSRRR